MSNLHKGKCSDEVKTTVPPEFHDFIAERACEQRCSPAELIRDALFLAFLGETYSGHVANDRRAAFSTEGRTHAEKGASE
jgi:hypothetical protein